MTHGKKYRKKQQHRASPIKSQISIRLEKLRNRRRHNLWSDDDDDCQGSTPSNAMQSGKNAACLICSILPKLTSNNCCPEHLSRLKRHSHRLSNNVTIQESTDDNRQRDTDVQQTPPMTVEPSSPIRSPLPPLASTIVIEPRNRKIPENPPSPIDGVRSLTTSNKPAHDPCIVIADEVVIDLERVVDKDDASPAANSPLEYTPTTARRTDTKVMAARLPKIPLKPGRFHHGRPITDPSTSNNGANEYRPSASTNQSPPNIRSSPQATTNPSDDVFTQDEPSTTTPTATNKKTSSRNGTRVSISRPALSTNAHSPLFNSLRRTSTDVTSFSKQL